MHTHTLLGVLSYCCCTLRLDLDLHNNMSAPTPLYNNHFPARCGSANAFASPGPFATHCAVSNMDLLVFFGLDELGERRLLAVAPVVERGLVKRPVRANDCPHTYTCIHTSQTLQQTMHLAIKERRKRGYAPIIVFFSEPNAQIVPLRYATEEKKKK